MKSRVSAEDNLMKDGDMGVRGWQISDVFDHPQGHLVGDHVASFGHAFVVPEVTGNDFNKIGFGGLWRGETLVSEEVTSGMDVVFDHVGSNGDAGDGLSLYEGDGIAGEEVVLRRRCG